MGESWQLALGIGALVVSILGLIHVYARHRDNRLSATLTRKDEEFNLKLDTQAQHFSDMLTAHDEKNTEDFEKVRKDVADLKTEMKREYAELGKKVDSITRTLDRVAGAREEKAAIMAQMAREKKE